MAASALPLIQDLAADVRPVLAFPMVPNRLLFSSSCCSGSIMVEVTLVTLVIFVPLVLCFNGYCYRGGHTVRQGLPRSHLIVFPPAP